MKRKYIIAFICILLIVSAINVRAEDIKAKATVRRGFAELCELYAYRAATYAKEIWKDYDLYISGPIGSPMSFDDCVHVSCSAGDAYVDNKDFMVNGLLMTFAASYATGDMKDQLSRSMIIAMSVLEYDSIKDDILSFEKSVFGGNNNALKEMLEVYNTTIAPEITDDFLRQLAKGDDILLYSGNYDYYARFYETKDKDSSDVKIIYLEAMAR